MNKEEILVQAIKLERDGQNAYLQAANLVEDPDTKKLFETLSEDESYHLSYLERQLESIQSGNSWIEIPKLDTIETIDKSAPIFPSGKKIVKQLPNNASEEDALLFGLNAEVKSYELYNQHAKQIDDQTAKNIFEGLARAEQNHFNLLMVRYDSRYGYPR